MDRASLSSDELAARAPFLVLNKIRPGDVLLTRGRGAESTAIAFATRGEFSHAAIWLRTDEATCLAESDDLGVGLTPLSLISIVSDSGPPQLVARVPGNPIASKLLRHPTVGTLSDEILRAATARIVRSSFARSYPDMKRLAQAGSLPTAARALARVILRIADRLSSANPNRIQGPFCSELVMRFFQEIGVPMFQEPIEPESVSPNQLASGSSALIEVQGALIMADAIGAHCCGTEITPTISRPAMLPVAVVDNEQNHAIRQGLEELTALLAEQRKALASESDRLGRVLSGEILQAFRSALAAGDTAAAERFRELAVRSLLLENIDRLARRYGESVAAITSAHFSEVLQCVQMCHLRMRGDLRYAFHRTSVLMHLRRRRSERQGPDPSWRVRRRRTKDRRILLNSIRSHKYLRRLNSEAIALDPTAVSTEGLNWIEGILAEANTATRSDWETLRSTQIPEHSEPGSAQATAAVTS